MEYFIENLDKFPDKMYSQIIFFNSIIILVDFSNYWNT